MRAQESNAGVGAVEDMPAPPAQKILQLRAAVNKWISDVFPTRRCHLSHTAPMKANGCWAVSLFMRDGKRQRKLADLTIRNSRVSLVGAELQDVAQKIDEYATTAAADRSEFKPCRGEFYDFRFGDGIAAVQSLEDRSVHLLLTDPPYGISNAYTCENQVPRRLRKNGKDFIMPRGHFGAWDDAFPQPGEWAEVVLPKVAGWAVVFCAQAQIGEYSQVLREHKFVAVGTLVWQKTNPVPFNHKFKPINAWEALVIGKRPGTKFNGRVVHNIFVCKSPSPQERIHPTQKPLPLVSRFIDLFSNEGDAVLDPFAGSATTVIAAAGKRRRVLAYENDPAIFEAARQRVMSTGWLL